MIQLIADDTKLFMNCLLRSEAFDNFLLYEMTLDVLHRYQFDGAINGDYLTDQERAIYEDQTYITWSALKPQITSILKNSHTPSNMKIVMSLNPTATLDIQQRLMGDQAVYPVKAFMINSAFDGHQVKATTAVNYSQFTMDKSIEQAFDGMMEKFFKKQELLMMKA